MSPITEFYTGRTVFVTGATGYMGKVLLEKMLRSLPGLEKIYILIRAKKGVTPEERVKQLRSNWIFTLNNIDEKCLNKIEAITGDITKDKLELSAEDRRKVLDEVSVVFHIAASIRMDLGLKEAVITNTKSTYELFKLCTEIKKLVSVVHLSTAFCNVEVSNMEEKVYPLDLDPYKIMDLVEWMDEKSLAAIENDLISPHPNTYTFTKRLSEMIAVDMGDKLPLVISRPSIVVPALSEPTTGWVDNLNGPSGLFLAAGKGVLRSALVDRKLIPQVIPVDLAINGVIIGGYERAVNNYSETLVMNLTQGSTVQISWGKIFDTYQALTYEHPLANILWYPRTSYTTNYYLHSIYTIFFHLLPALVVDFLLIIFLQKPFLIRIQNRISLASKSLFKFTVTKWDFSILETVKIFQRLDEDDKKIFPTSYDYSDFAEYCSKTYFFGRDQFLKEGKYPRLQMFQLKVLYVLDIFFKTLCAYGILKIIWNWFQGVF